MTSVAPILTLAEPFAYQEVHKVCKLKLLKARKISLAGVKIKISGSWDILTMSRYEARTLTRIHQAGAKSSEHPCKCQAMKH